MASPFSMLTMLRRARKPTPQRTASTVSISDETASTATLATTTASATATLISSSSTLNDTSDTASIRSAKVGERMRKGTLLTRMSSSALPPAVTADTIHASTPEFSPPPTSSQPILAISESPTLLSSELPSDGGVADVSAEETKPQTPIAESDPTGIDAQATIRTESPTNSDEGKTSVDVKVAEDEATKARLLQLEAEKSALEAEKSVLESEKARLILEFKEKEERLEEDRRAEKLAFEAERATFAKELKEKNEQWDSQQRTQEGERARLVEDMEARANAWQEEKGAEKKRRDDEMALVERDNETLTTRVVVLEDTLEELQTTARNVEDELVQVRDERDTAMEDTRLLQLALESATEEVQQLRHDEIVQQQRYTDLTEELLRVQRERDADLAMREDRIESLEDELTESRKELSEVRQAAEIQDREKNQSIEELKDQMSAYYNYVEETDRRNRLLSDQLKRQSMEIHFVKPSDSRHLLKSAAEPTDAALRILNHFNSEVFQAAASFADCIDNDTTLDTAGLEDLEPLIVRLAPVMSRDLAEALRTAYTDPTQDPDTLLLQVAFQASMTHCANRFINSWYPFQWEHGDLLQILYGRILDAGMKETAETWRATTKALLRLTSESHPQLVAYFRDTIFDVLAVVGRPKSQEAVEALVKEYEDKFSLIARLTIRLHIIFNDILSNDAPCNLGSYIGSPGSEFLHKHLEDCYPDGDTESETDLLSDNRVLCTAELGLRTIQNGVQGGVILLKPKVVLSTILSSGW